MHHEKETKVEHFEKEKIKKWFDVYLLNFIVTNWTPLNFLFNFRFFFAFLEPMNGFTDKFFERLKIYVFQFLLS